MKTSSKILAAVLGILLFGATALTAMHGVPSHRHIIQFANENQGPWPIPPLS